MHITMTNRHETLSIPAEHADLMRTLGWTDADTATDTDPIPTSDPVAPDLGIVTEDEIEPKPKRTRTRRAAA